MSLTDRTTFLFFNLCLLAMPLPYLYDLFSAGNNIFINDFYAKRIISVLLIPFFIYVILASFRKKISFTTELIYYMIWIIFILVISILKKNSLVFVITDLVIYLIPVCFYLLINKTNFSIKAYKFSFPIYLLIACLITIFGIKLQFSYFSLLAIGYVFFIPKYNFIKIILLIIMPFILLNSLIGKSSLLLVLIIVGYFIFFDKKMSNLKRIFIFIPISFLLLLGFVFSDQVKSTGAYKNTFYFLSHADLQSLEFMDHSTLNRVYEAEMVLEGYNNANSFYKFFGQGFGSTVDLSKTIDKTIETAQSDSSKSRVIHMGFFAVLHKIGLLGIFLYFLLLKNIISATKVIFRESDSPVLILSALYLIIIFFDSHISFSHMMSNFMFWFILFIVKKAANDIKTKNLMGN